MGGFVHKTHRFAYQNEHKARSHDRALVFLAY